MLRRKPIGAVALVKRLAASGALVAALWLLVEPSAGTAPAASTQSVSLAVTQTYDGPSRSYLLRFGGAISSPAPGEDVTVMQQICGYKFATAIAGTQTRAGGVWDAEPSNPYLVPPSATYRARWRNLRSEPVTLRPPIPVYFIPVGRGRWRVSVSIGSVYQDLRERVVVAQRLAQGRWTTIGRQKLVIQPSGGGPITYGTTFVIRKQGWTVRALVPAKSAAPCFRSSVSQKWTS